MNRLFTILVVMGVTFLGAAILGVAWIALRQTLRRFSGRKLAKQAEQVRAALHRLRKENYADLDKLLFEMRDTCGPSILMQEMQAELSSAVQSGAADVAPLV